MAEHSQPAAGKGQDGAKHENGSATDESAVKQGARSARSARGTSKGDHDAKADERRASEAVPRGPGPLPASSGKKQDHDEPEFDNDTGDKGKGEGSSSNELFKKYDHSEYVKKIRSEADKLVENAPSCFYARLCRDFILDEWTVDTFHKSGKTYSYTTYFWDSVDQQWEKTSESTTYPLSDWKRYLKFSAAGKECYVLKK